jgi:magnesium-protoporphyrin IX monomethyl ester (oxidative) cyclase
MLSVVLINPPQIFSKTQVVAGVTPPLGPAYLAGVLRQNGHWVRIIDALGENPEQLTPNGNLLMRGLTLPEILKSIPARVDLIGISNLYTFAFPFVSHLAREIKDRFPHTPIVLGGAHVTSLPEVSIADPNVDYIILSEGEQTLLELCEAIAGRKDVSGIDGFGFKLEGEPHINPKTRFIPDLDSIPFPLREMLPMDNYLKVAEPHGAVRGRWTTMIATRGCPFSCSFCNTPYIWQRKWRARGAANVVDEMEELKRLYAIDDFHFEDENMSTSRKWMLDYCDELVDRDLRVGWQLSNGVHVSTVDHEVLSRMKASGLTNIGVAPESGARRVLEEVIHKQVDFNALRAVVRNAADLGITITSYFIIGFPNETRAEIKQTAGLVKDLARLGLDECSINTLQVVPGCELFYEMVGDGKIEVNDGFFSELGQMGDLAGVKTWSETLTDRQLSGLKRKMYLSFYLTSFFHHPSKAWRLLRNLFNSVQETKSERVMHTLIKHNLPFLRRSKIK